MKCTLGAYCSKKYGYSDAYSYKTIKYIDDGHYVPRLKGKVCELVNGSTYYKGVYQGCGINLLREFVFLEDTCKIGGELVE